MQRAPAAVRMGICCPPAGDGPQDAGAIQRWEPRARHRLARHEDDPPVPGKRAEEGAVVDGRPHCHPSAAQRSIVSVFKS